MNTLRLDDDYTRRKRVSETTLSEHLYYQTRRKDIPFETTDLNKQGWGDVMWMGLAGVHSGEIKGAGEFVGDLDHCEAQLQKQIQNCDRPFLFIYGQMEEAPDGGVYALTSIGEERVIFERDADSRISRTYNRRHFRRNYAGVRTKLARFSQMGVEVFEAPSLDALATQVIACYTVSQQEGSTFTRLIPEKFQISETDARRRAFMLTLMGIQGAGIGEEVADAIATWCLRFENQPPANLSLAGLIHGVKYYGEGGEISLDKAPLRSGKRTIGPAAVKKLKTALGV